MKWTRRGGLALIGAVTLTTSLAACSGGSSGDGDGALVLGASLSLTGPLGGIGVPQKVGYQQAEKDINAAGGLAVGSVKRKIKIVFKDNRSDPATASQQARDLVLKDDSVALLGACTPTIVVPVGLVAETLKVPYVSTCNPVGAFRAGSKTGWKYSFDFFFDEQDQAKQVFAGAAKSGSNQKVALFTDTEPDGVAERPLYKKAAEAAGFTVVGDYTFPVGTTDFSSFIQDAKGKGAQVVVAQMVPPDGIALWKQFKSLDFAPRFALASKAVNQVGWVPALGDVGDGALSEEFWDQGAGLPDTAELKASLGAKLDNVPALNFGVMSYTVVKVLAAAVEKAGTTDAGKVVAALEKTDADFPLAHIAFGADHTAATPYLLYQWQGGTFVQVLPEVGGSALVAPTAGLQ